MKLIYLTAKTYPASTADHIYVRELARGFSNLLKDDFSLVVANDYSEELKDIHTINLKLKFRKGRSLYYFFWLPYFIKKQKNKDLIIFTNDPILLTILALIKKLFFINFRICSDWHMLFNDWKDQFIIKNSDYLITTSQKLRELLIDKGAPESKLFVAYGGVNLALYNQISMNKAEIRSEIGLPGDNILVGYIGLFKTMKMEKGLSTMILSLKNLPPSVKMVFCGGKDEEIVEYRTLAKETGVENRCCFFDRKDPHQVILFQKAMDFLVIPYPNKPHFRDYGFPMKVYEYMASNAPIIYSNLKLIDEMLYDCGKSFIADNPKNLAETISELINNPDVSAELALKAKQKVSPLDWKNKSQNIWSFISNNHH